MRPFLMLLVIFANVGVSGFFPSLYPYSGTSSLPNVRTVTVLHTCLNPSWKRIYSPMPFNTWQCPVTFYPCLLCTYYVILLSCSSYRLDFIVMQFGHLWVVKGCVNKCRQTYWFNIFLSRYTKNAIYLSIYLSGLLINSVSSYEHLVLTPHCKGAAQCHH